MSAPYTRYVITLTRDPAQACNEPLIRAHIAWLRELDAAGALVLAGPFEDGRGGMIILEAGSRGHAEALAHADPFVTEGYANCELRTWQLSCEENNHMGMG